MCVVTAVCLSGLCILILKQAGRLMVILPYYGNNVVDDILIKDSLHFICLDFLRDCKLFHFQSRKFPNQLRNKIPTWIILGCMTP